MATGSGVVQAGINAGSSAITSGFTQDPQYYSNTLRELLINQGIPAEKVNDIVNAFEGKFKGTEFASQKLNGQTGAEFLDGYTKEFYLGALTKGLGIKEEQAKKAIELFSSMSQQFNQAHLSAEQTKLSAQVSMYSAAGSLLGTFYGFGALVNSFMPGSADKFLNALEGYMTRIQDKIEEQNISPADKNVFSRSFSAARASMATTTVFSPKAAIAQGAPLAGDAIDPKTGKSTIVGGLVDNATSAAGSATNPETGTTPAPARKGLFSGVKVNEPAPAPGGGS